MSLSEENADILSTTAIGFTKYNFLMMCAGPRWKKAQNKLFFIPTFNAFLNCAWWLIKVNISDAFLTLVLQKVWEQHLSAFSKCLLLSKYYIPDNNPKTWVRVVTFALKKFTLSSYLYELIIFQKPCIKYNHLSQSFRRLCRWKIWSFKMNRIWLVGSQISTYQSTWCHALPCDYTTLNNTPVFQTLLRSACTLSKLFLFPTLSTQRGGWGWAGLGRGHSQNNLPRLTHVIFLVMSCSEIKYQGKEEGEMVVMIFCLARLALRMPRLCLPGGVWTFASWWKVLSEFLPCFALLCMYRFYFIYKLSFPWFIPCHP